MAETPGALKRRLASALLPITAALAAWALWSRPAGLVLAPGAEAVLPAFDLPCEGDLLHARAVADPDFAGRTVILCLHDESGALGVVMGEPTGETWGVAAGASEAGLVRVGGPLGRGQRLVLLEDAEGLRLRTTALAPRFPWPGWLHRPEGRVVGVFDGHAGWAPGQLEREIALGAWTVQAR